MADRMLHTQCQRRHPKETHFLSAAVIPDPPSSGMIVAANESADIEKDEVGQYIEGFQNSSAFEHAETYVVQSDYPIVALGKPLVLFSQYLTLEPTTLVVHEIGPFRLPDSFTVTNPTTNTTLPNIHQDPPSLSQSQQFVDAQTNQPLFCIRRQLGQFPRSYDFEDADTEQTILDLQGNFFRAHPRS